LTGTYPGCRPDREPARGLAQAPAVRGRRGRGGTL